MPSTFYCRRSMSSILSNLFISMQVGYKISSLQYVQVVCLCGLPSRNKTWRRYFNTCRLKEFEKVTALGWSFPLFKLPGEKRSYGGEETFWRYGTLHFFVMKSSLI